MNINLIIIIFVIFFGGLFSSSSKIDYTNGLEHDKPITSLHTAYAKELDLDACNTDPSSALCSLYCENFPLDEDLCNKASENKAILEANAESVISKCLSNSSSAGCNPSMTHLIKRCESFNYLLAYCDREKFTQSIFYKFYIIEHNAEIGVPATTTMHALNISSKDVERVLNEAKQMVNEAQNGTSSATRTENVTNATETAMDKVRKLLER